MQLSPIPTPPTDDLWKFCAITGIWILCGLSVLMSFTVYVLDKSYDRTAAVTQEAITSSYVRCMDTRIDELRSNKQQSVDPCVERNNFQNMSLQDLEHFKEVVSARLPGMEQDVKDNKSDTYFRWLKRAYVYTWLPFGLVASLVMVYLGFRGWAKGQKLAAKSLDLDLRIKAQQLRLLELEEAQRLLAIRPSGWP